MQDFFDFYQYGGFFNHVVTLLCLVALASLVMHAARPQRPGGDTSLLQLSERFAALGVAAGVLGTIFGVIELSAALATVDADLFLPAANRGMSIVPVNLAWSLLCAIPLWIASTCMRQRNAA